MNYFRRAECGLFASRSITAHILRGALAAALLTWAWLNQSSHPLFAGAALVVAVVAMRGCPTCWTVGLFETITHRLGRQTSSDDVVQLDRLRPRNRENTKFSRP